MDTNRRAVLSIEVPLELRENFIACARSNDVAGSQIIRAFMRDYIKMNSQNEISKPLKMAA